MSSEPEEKTPPPIRVEIPDAKTVNSLRKTLDELREKLDELDGNWRKPELDSKTRGDELAKYKAALDSALKDKAYSHPVFQNEIQMRLDSLS
jgi:hypothetical protein